MELWVRPTGHGRWDWGRGDQAAGRLVANADGGIEPVDDVEDLDLVTVLCMARAGLTTWDPAAEAHRHRAGPPPTTSTSTWSRSTSGRAKGGGLTLGQRATH